MEHKYQDLIHLFNETFYQEYNTKLVKGEDEPIYKVADDECSYNQIIFAHGYFASALHEMSHWCIAGKERRQLEDYGYWYCADGRDEQEQNEFQKAEIRPQSLDWLFCLATRYPFNVSCDNLNGDFEPDRAVFRELVKNEVITMLKTNTIPPRAKRFLAVLNEFYGTQEMTLEVFNEQIAH